MSDSDTLHIVLAAGEGTRMRSSMPKVLHQVANLPMIGHVVRVVRTADPHGCLIVVRGPDHDAVENAVLHLAPSASFTVQTDRLGTAHAVLSAHEQLTRATGPVLVLFGDTPLLSPKTLETLRQSILEGASVSVVGFDASDPAGYGRLLMSGDQLDGIREEKDASVVERSITLCNGGLMAFDGKVLPGLLDAIGNDNAKGEYYLTDAVAIARKRGLKVSVVMSPEEELAGVNTRAHLASAEAVIQSRLREQAMADGVTMIDPTSVYLSMDTLLGRDVIIEPNVVFGPGVSVADGVVIRAFSHIEGAHVGEGAAVGPYARLRPGTTLGPGAKAGNFVEIKKADIGGGAKINHLSYIGDATIGAGANLGAGTITCNYDGGQKHRTVVGDRAFIGSNSALVAPVVIGDDAYVGSGSVITDDVPDGALAIARGRQVNKPDRAPKPKTSD